MYSLSSFQWSPDNFKNKKCFWKSILKLHKKCDSSWDGSAFFNASDGELAAVGYSGSV